MPAADNPRAVMGGNNPPNMIELPTVDALKKAHADIFKRLTAWKASVTKLGAIVDAPQTLADCNAIDAVVRTGLDLANDANSVREAEKKPFLEAEKVIDTLFNVDVRDVIGSDVKKGGTLRTLLQRSADRRLALGKAEQARLDAEAKRIRDAADAKAAQAKRDEDAGRVKQADVAIAHAEGLDRQADMLEARAAAPLQEATRSTVGGVTSSVKGKLVCTGVVRAELDLNALRPYFKQEHLVDAVNAGLKLEGFSKLAGAAIEEKAVGSVRR